MQAHGNPHDVALRFTSIMKSYLGRRASIDLNARLVADLKITGWDFLDLVTDLENEFGVDLAGFLIGPEPEYVSTGLLGRLVREPQKPVYRDVSLKELQDFLAS